MWPVLLPRRTRGNLSARSPLSPSSCPVVGSDLGPGRPTPAATSDALRLAWSLTGVPRCAGSVPVPAWQESTLDPANPPRLTLPRSGSDVRVSQLTRSRPRGRPRPSLVRWNDLTASTGRGGEPKARNGPPNGRDSRSRGRHGALQHGTSGLMRHCRVSPTLGGAPQLVSSPPRVTVRAKTASERPSEGACWQFTLPSYLMKPNVRA
jgi:hypothetical protein